MADMYGLRPRSGVRVFVVTTMMMGLTAGGTGGWFSFESDPR